MGEGVGRGLSSRARVQATHIQPWYKTGSQEPCPIGGSLDVPWLSTRCRGDNEGHNVAAVMVI